MKVNRRGCNCTKNSCLKKYCQCYKLGSSCTKLCTCVLCKNSKKSLTANEISDFKDKGYRRKHKIVISGANSGKRDVPFEETAVIFIKHKKKRKTKRRNNNWLCCFKN